VILTQRQLNRALLARQGLLERRALSLPAALDAMGTLQAQYAPSMYIGLWSRVAEFERDALTEALYERTVVQATLMRSTIHLASRADYWPLALAIREARRVSWLRATKQPAPIQAAERLREALRDGPMKRAEIEALIGKTAAHGVGMWVDLVRVPPSGTWERRRADLYGLAETWVGPPVADPDRLVTRYLTGYGPASRADIANWAGMPPRDLPSLESLRRFEAEDGTELVDLPEASLPDPDTPAPVRFLGTWDAALLVHARRTQILPEEHRAKIFNTKMPQSVGTFLVDGSVKGAWRPNGEIEPFEPLTAPQRREVEAEARRLAEFSA
jgi:Winged helix DNA-binding domain